MAYPLETCHSERRSPACSFDEDEHFFRSQFSHSEVNKTENCLIVYLSEKDSLWIEIINLFSEVTRKECTHNYTKCSFPLSLVNEIVRMRDIFYHVRPLGLKHIGILHKAERVKLPYNTDYDEFKILSENILNKFYYRPHASDSELILTKSILDKYTVIAEVQENELSKHVVHVIRQHLASRNAGS